MISVDQLDLLTKHAAAEILNRHFRRFDRPLAAKVGIVSGLIVENAICTPCADAGALKSKAHAAMAEEANWIILALQIMFPARCV